MKQLLALLALSVCAFAQSPSGAWTLTGTGATSSASALDFGARAATRHTLQVVVGGSPSACTIRLEGSLDNVNFFDISGTQTCTSTIQFSVDARAEKYVRANLLTWTGGTNAVITYVGSN